MKKIDDIFYITVSPDKMSAMIHCKESYMNEDIELSISDITNFLKDNNIIFGIDKVKSESLLDKLPQDKFPILIAKGEEKEDGLDGRVIFEGNYTDTDVERDENWSFREVMRIPTVVKGEKLAYITLPTAGENGKNIHGQTLYCKPGRPARLRGGQGVVFQETDQSYYATTDGQVSVVNEIIQVISVFKVDGSLSLEVGNLDFVGSIVINGDVPTGYTVKATADIKIYGIVEAATITSGGSIYVSGGLSGLNKGTLSADKDIHIGYINQGTVNAGENIFVDNSIIHSNCVAGRSIISRNGNIIGGAVSGVELIEANDIGNRLNTSTSIKLERDQCQDNIREKLIVEKNEITKNLEKVKKLGGMLTNNTKQQDSKMKIAQLRQKNTFQQLSKKIDEINIQLQKISSQPVDGKSQRLIVRNSLYPNVKIVFGKYQKNIKVKYKNVQLKVDQSDIVFHQN